MGSTHALGVLGSMVVVFRIWCLQIRCFFGVSGCRVVVFMGSMFDLFLFMALVPGCWGSVFFGVQGFGV